MPLDVEVEPASQHAEDSDEEEAEVPQQTAQRFGLSGVVSTFTSGLYSASRACVMFDCNFPEQSPNVVTFSQSDIFWGPQLVHGQGTRKF